MIIANGPHRAKLTCPECGADVAIPVHVDTRLVVESDRSQLTFKVRSKPVDHECGGVASQTLFVMDQDGSVVDADVAELES